MDDHSWHMKMTVETLLSWRARRLQIDWDVAFFHNFSHWNNHHHKHHLFSLYFCQENTQVARTTLEFTLCVREMLRWDTASKGEVPALSFLYHIFIHDDFFSECLTRFLFSVQQGLGSGWSIIFTPISPGFHPKGYSMAFQTVWNNWSRFRFHLNLFTGWSCGEAEWHKASFCQGDVK